MKMIFAIALVLTSGCHHASTAPVVSLAQLADSPPNGEPFWLAVKVGDKLPVDVAVVGDLVESPPQTVNVTAKQNFFVLFSEDEPRISLDRETFLSGAGSLKVGIGTNDTGASRASIKFAYSTR